MNPKNDLDTYAVHKIMYVCEIKYQTKGQNINPYAFLKPHFSFFIK